MPKPDGTLTQEEMETLFDDPPPGAIVPSGLVDTGSLRGAVERAFRQPAAAPAQQHSNFYPKYQSVAEQYFQAGWVVGRGDATYVVKDQLKAMGCKWHGLRERWVAPSAAVLAAAKEIVKAGPPAAAMGKGSLDQGQANWVANRERKRAAFEAKRAAACQVTKAKSAAVGQMVAVDFDAFMGAHEHHEPPLDPAALLLDLENRGVVTIPADRVDAAFNGQLAEDELLATFAESDKAFDL